jgi:hypothetical protein
MRCEGRPGIDCPFDKHDPDITFCQGDMWLCKDCEEFRFPRAKSTTASDSSSRPEPKRPTNLTAPSDHHHIPAELLTVIVPPLAEHDQQDLSNTEGKASNRDQEEDTDCSGSPLFGNTVEVAHDSHVIEITCPDSTCKHKTQSFSADKGRRPVLKPIRRSSRLKGNPHPAQNVALDCPSASKLKNSLKKNTTTTDDLKQVKSPGLNKKACAAGGFQAQTNAVVPDGYISLMIKQPPMPLGAKFYKNTLIVNELLCYLQQKMDTVPVNVLIKLVSDFYDTESIKSAKELLFELVPAHGLRYRKCIGPNKDSEDVSDMIKLLLAAELSEVPIFLAQDLNQLPSLTTDCHDMSAILKKIEYMQSSISILSDSQKELTTLVHSNVTQLPEPLRLRDGVNTHEQSEAEVNLESDDKSPINNTTEGVSEQPESDDDSLSIVSLGTEEETPLAPPFVKKPVYSRIITNSKRKSSTADNQSHQPSNVQTRPFSWAALAKRSGTSYAAADTQPYPRSKRRRQSDNPQSSHSVNDTQRETVMIGCGNAPGLHVARRHNHKQSSSGYNRTCTGIFVTNLHPRTNPRQLEVFVKRETGLKVAVEKLKTRFSTYSSFYIPAEQQQRRMLLDSYLWPAGCKVKPYFS